ncbi:hypothetical protein CJ030_MR1G004790 [Morella rubra]|uniref:Uncharacterized protein n=1 Tax=Morella rubra TaxID=262757 RepID=A0A6A1WHZ9_9ROSI|nr:hypothetical protein CJ030_MR1G004790 [Morella rubra]
MNLEISKDASDKLASSALPDSGKWRFQCSSSSSRYYTRLSNGMDDNFSLVK